MKMLTETEFKLKYRETQDAGGHSYDPWDVACAWGSYQKDPSKWDRFLGKVEKE